MRLTVCVASAIFWWQRRTVPETSTRQILRDLKRHSAAVTAAVTAEPHAGPHARDKRQTGDKRKPERDSKTDDAFALAKQPKKVKVDNKPATSPPARMAVKQEFEDDSPVEVHCRTPPPYRFGSLSR